MVRAATGTRAVRRCARRFRTSRCDFSETAERLLYDLHAARGGTLVLNGTADDVVSIPKMGATFFEDCGSARWRCMAGRRMYSSSPGFRAEGIVLTL